MLRIFTGLFIILFSCVFEPVTAVAPWQIKNERKLPWSNEAQYNSNRKERRESFFRDLSQSSYESSENTDVSLASLPWDEYKTQYREVAESDFIWPVANSKISSGFGVRRGKFHEGLDFGGLSGQKIRAVAGGRVVYSGNMGGYGRVVVIYHGDNLSSVYAHNRENLVQKGQIVQQGQTIATVGASGNARGTHLHFEFRQNGKPVNPLRFRFESEAVSMGDNDFDEAL